MKFSKIFAGIAACAVSVSAMAVCAFAGTATYSTTITADSSSDDTKMVQISYADLGIPADAEAITNISFDCAWDCSSAGWAGGGGAVGFQANDADDGWMQADMVNVPTDIAVTTWSESIDFAADGQDIAAAYAEGFVQFGWWWGADPSVEISNITVTYTGGTAAETTTTTVAVTTTVADTTTTVADTTTAAEEDDTADTTTAAADNTTDADDTTAATTAAADTTTTAATTTAAAANNNTGVEGVAGVLALLAIAGTAVVVTKKR